MITPELTVLTSVKAVGLSVRTSNKDEFDISAAKIAGLWNRFYGEKWAEKIIDSNLNNNSNESPVVLGIYSNYETDENGFYKITAAILVPDTDVRSTFPEPLEVINIPKAEYLVFKKEGSMPETIISIWTAVWNYFSQENVPYVRTFSYDLEIHQSESQAAVYIAVKPS